MKIVTIILTVLFVALSNITMPVLAVSPSITSIHNPEASTYAIISENYVGDWTDYYSFYYDELPEEWNKNIHICFRIKATYRYNEATLKVYGSAGTLKIEADEKLYGCDIVVYNINHSTPTIANDGYSWMYPNVTFDMKVSYENRPQKTYTNISLGAQYVPG